MTSSKLKQLFRKYDDGNLLITDEKYRSLDGYQHVQHDPSKSWFIPHNKGTSSFSINVFLNDELVECDIEVIDEYSVVLNFSDEVVGFANLLFLIDTSKKVIPPTPSVTPSVTISPSVTPTPSPLPVSQYSMTIMAKNPVAYWSLETLSDSISGNLLSLGPNASLVPDSYGNTLFFASSTLQSGLGAFMATPFTLNKNYTLEAWVKITSTSTAYSTFFGDTTGNSYGIQTDNSNSHIFMYGAVDSIDSGYVLTSTTNYVHLVVTVDSSGNVNFYVNGTKVNTSTGVAQDTYTFGILGCDTYYQEALIGYIGDPAIYDYELTSAQILENYNAGLNYRY